LENFGHKLEFAFTADFLRDAETDGWREFLGRPAIEDVVPDWKAFHAGKTILVAGAGGSIGSHLATRLLPAKPGRLILLDRGEHNLYKIHGALSAASGQTRVIAALADIGDPAALEEVFASYRPDLVYHAAAFKQVPILEQNPLAALHNNALGTWELAKTAARHNVPRMVALSTDKAANPRSVLGASKRIAELVLLALNQPGTHMNSLRLGNVLGSRGSVVPLFLRQIARGGPVTVTHRDICRFFLTLDESVELLLAVAAQPDGGQLFTPELGDPIPVLRLAEHLIRRAGFTPGKEISIAITGVRPGDKMAEDLISDRESRAEAVNRWLYRVATTALSAGELTEALNELQGSIEKRDGAAALETACRIVPEFQPSAELRQTLSAPGSEVHA
jgi:FlaA1/EpsC-like NDP-sugar epimerase